MRPTLADYGPITPRLPAGWPERPKTVFVPSTYSAAAPAPRVLVAHQATEGTNYFARGEATNATPAGDWEDLDSAASIPPSDFEGEPTEAYATQTVPDIDEAPTGDFMAMVAAAPRLAAKKTEEQVAEVTAADAVETVLRKLDPRVRETLELNFRARFIGVRKLS